MISLTLFAGWGPCGPLNSAGETEYYSIVTALQLLALAVSGLILLAANSRYVKRFNTNKTPKTPYLLLNIVAGLIRAFIIFTVAKVLIDLIFGDANLGAYDGNIACDPIDGGITIQASFIFLLSLFLCYRQLTRYLFNRNELK